MALTAEQLSDVLREVVRLTAHPDCTVEMEQGIKDPHGDICHHTPELDGSCTLIISIPPEK